MFIAALFTIAKTWKQPRCPSVGEWINELWYIPWNIIQTKKKGLSSHEETRWNLKCVLLSEKSQSKKAAYCIIPAI